MLLRITDSHRTIILKTKEIESAKISLRAIISNQHLAKLEYAINTSRNCLISRKLQDHDKKLNSLLHNYGYRPKTTWLTPNSHDLSPSIQSNNLQVNDEKWVTNLSSKKLDKYELSVLKKGPKFAVAPNTIPVLELLKGVETGLRRIPNKNAVSIARTKITGILRQARTPPSNLSQQEQLALRSLNEDESIVITNADKGNTTVVFNKMTYITKMLDLLNDCTTYKIVKNPLKQIISTLNSYIWNLYKDDHITKSMYHHLRCSSGNLARIYGLAKLHKNHIPLRPVVSMVGHPTYNLSKFICNFLDPLIDKKFIVRNSNEFVSDIQNINIANDEMQVSFDVVSLFTKIPINTAKTIIMDKLSSNRDIFADQQFSINNFKTALDLICSTVVFTFQNICYQQIEGFPMGLPPSGKIGDIVLNSVENQALNSFLNPPKIWKRFVDDVWAIVKSEHLENFFHHLNNINPNIQFTLEKEINNKIHFLDVAITRSNNILTTNLYQKPTHSNRYLHFTSHHPLSQKTAITKTLYSRANNIIMDNQQKIKQQKNILHVLLQNGYPIKHALPPPKNTKIISNTGTQNRPTSYTTLPYIQGVSEKIKRVLSTDVGIKVSFKPYKTLKHFLPNPKDKIPVNQKTGLVYQIPCLNCNKVYIGETKRTLHTRKKEHCTAIRKNQPNKSALCEHAMDNDHLIDWNNAKVLHYEQNYYERLFVESWHINKNVDSINRKNGNDFPTCYNCLNQ